MKKRLAALSLIFSACASSPEPGPQVEAENTPPPVETAESPLASGLDKEGFDTSVAPQDDLFRHVNGKWLDSTQIPADKSNYGMFIRLEDEAQENIKKIVESTDDQKIADFYNTWMNEARAEELGVKPLEEDLKRIRGLKTMNDVVAEIGRMQRYLLAPLFVGYVAQDAKKATEYILYLNQGGLGMPDRDYYLKDDPKMEATRQAYVAYIEKIFTLAGRKDGKDAAKKIYDLEKALAEKHWTRVESRDREKTYNKHDQASLKKLSPKIAWPVFFEGAGIPAPAAVVVRQPSYFEAFTQQLNKVPLSTWKLYLEWHLLNGFAPYLSRDFVDASFAFYGTTISGTKENEPRWKRALRSLDGALGEAVGKLYVEKHFKPEAKQRMEQLVSNLRTAFHQGIDTLEWMTPATKEQAKEKLAKFVWKIGYPEKWRDYTALEIKADDLAGNIQRARIFEHQRNIKKLGQPIDRGEWFMTPQTVNAYYSSTMNEIVFPAAILQPPFFNLAADDAVNYGAIGAVIGHELSHGFDDQGRKSDGDGNLRDWWTKEDAEQFKARAQLMVSQYAGYEPLPGKKLNGELTLGENIGDLGGLTIAYRAYQLSLEGKEPPVIDGWTGPQRFFLGWAQVWRRKYRDEELMRRLVVDTHSPSEFRVLGVVSNMPEFYEAFGVKEGHKLWRPADQRVKIW